MGKFFFRFINKLGGYGIIFLCLSPLFQLRVNSSESSPIENINQVKYTLGTGDVIDIRVYKSPEFDSKVKVLSDGTINLIRLGSLYIEGLTINEAKELIRKEYKKILKLPIISLNLTKSRPLRVSVLGEVKRPGFYSINPQRNISQVLNSDGGESIIESSQGWPTLVEALQKAGGITQKSNLKKISLTRESNTKNKVISTIDFYNPLTKNDALINPKIYDGDIIFVPKAQNQVDSNLRNVTISNLSAPSITVNIIGEVTQPGEYNLTSDTPINHAILFAGGFTARANKNFVKLVRLRDNGTILSKKYNYNLDSNRSSKENPALRDKDVLIVTTNAYNKLGDTLNNALTPLNPIIKGVRIYTLLD